MSVTTALDIAFIGDVTATLFAAFFFLASGISIGFMIGRRRYLKPLLQMESELRRHHNEALREKFFNERSSQGTRAETIPAPLTETVETKVDSSEPDHEPVLDLRRELETVRESHLQEVRLLKDEIFDLKRKIKLLNQVIVAEPEHGEIKSKTIDVLAPDTEPSRDPSEVTKDAPDGASLPTDDAPVQDNDVAPPQYEAPALTPAHEQNTSSVKSEPEESILDSVSFWTQKLFGLLDEQEEEEANDLTETVVGVNLTDDIVDNVIDEFTEDVAEEVVQETDIDSDLRLPPPFRSLADLIDRAAKQGPGAAKPSDVYSLTSTQESLLEQMGFNSFEMIGALEPMDIIRLAAALNVPISDIEAEWIPVAHERILQTEA